MNKINEKIDLLKQSILKIQNKEYQEYFNMTCDILDDLSHSVEQMMENQAVLVENLNCIDEDISDIQGELFEEVSIEELEDMEDQYEEIKCKNCGKPIFMETSVLKTNTNIECPYCKNNIR